MNKYSCNTSMLDVLFCSLLGFIALFVVAFTLIKDDNTKQNDNNAKLLGDVMVTLTWDSNRNDDADLWVQDPEGEIVFFNKPQGDRMHLDRDDVGSASDMIDTETGEGYSIGNQEIIIIRSLKPGEYIINVHAFVLRELGPLEISVRIDRIGSDAAPILAKTLTLDRTGIEVTVARIVFDEDGKVVKVSNVPKSLMREVERDADPYGDMGP